MRNVYEMDKLEPRAALIEQAMRDDQKVDELFGPVIASMREGFVAANEDQKRISSVRGYVSSSDGAFPLKSLK